MAEPIHIAITRQVRKGHTQEFERLLAGFASRSLNDPGSRGVHLIYPPPGSEKAEYGILRSFASETDREAFYNSPLYREWTLNIEPLTEGGPEYRQMNGLEAWFREPHSKMPPRWKMALLTWLAVWPVSMAVPAVLGSLLGGLPSILRAGIIAGGIVLVLTWAAMPLLVKLARPWLNPKPKVP